MLRVMLSGCIAAASVIHAGSVTAQGFPAKPIRIVATEPGGGGDFAARILAQGITGPLGQSVVVENRPSGVIPGEIVARATPDGHTLLVAASVFVLGPLLQKTPYDPVKDFVPVTLVMSSPSLLVSHPSVPVSSVKELVALAKARPGELNYASSGLGASNHLAGELFKAMTGVDIVRVPYKGSGPALTNLVGGQVQIMFSATPTALPHVRTGKLRSLAVTSPKPSILAPGVPTMASTIPGYESVTIFGVWAPAKTPDAVVAMLNREMVQVLGRADVKEKLLTAGVEAAGSTPGELTAAMKGEIDRMGKVIRDAGIRAD
jgi:tripartite-type tricarboxylate transporter receptor subunit TctC